MDFKTYIDNYAAGTVRLTSGVKYDQRKVIEQNILDKNATFEKPFYADGTEKMFFNVPFIMERVLYNNTDIDTKDVQIKAENEATINITPLLRGALKHHFTEYDYGEEINAYREELIGMGHILVKQVGEETKQVNLLNVVRPSHIMDIQKGGLAERVLLSWDDMLEHKSEWQNWDKVKELKKTLDKLGKETFVTYEWWKMDEFEVNGKKKTTKGCVRYLDLTPLEETQANTPENWEPYVELERFPTTEFEKVKSKKRLKRLIASGYLEPGDTEEPIYPYEEQRLFKVPGRWMGLGVYERLRPVTKAFNKTHNSKLRFDELYHKGILTHTAAPGAVNGKGAKRTLTNDVINRLTRGAVVPLKAGEKLERLNLGNMLVDFLQTADKYFEFARQLAGVTASGTGEALPSSTPATIGVINQQTAKTVFDVINEQQSLFLKRLFRRFKMKSILEELTEQEAVKILGDPKELEEMEAPFIENLVHASIPQSVNQGLIVPTSSELPIEEIEKYKEAVRVVRSQQGDMRFAELKKEIIEGLNFNIDFYITNETFDKATMLANIQDTITSVLTIPNSEYSVDKLIAEKLDLMGMSPRRYRKSPQEIQQAQMAAMAHIQAANPVVPAPAGMTPGEKFGQDNQLTI